jgi:phospholipid/cholesterol/gamma-HCH transport system ATP-binding protein
MTLAENVALPLSEFTDLTPSQLREVASVKLALVGPKGFEDFYPSQISGAMQKRAGLARAMALDPEVLFSMNLCTYGSHQLPAAGRPDP